MNIRIIPVLVFIILLISGVSSAQDERLPLNPPPGYYGSITVNGQPASPGTTIVAKIGAEERGSITTAKPGFYGDDPGPSKLWIRGYQNETGSTVTFYVSGVAAQQTATLSGAGTTKREDLSFVGVPLPTPTETSGGNGNSRGGGSSDGGGGGGGGGPSGENFSNIEVRESYEDTIYKDKVTSYRFKNGSNPILFINITGNINAGLITTTVDVLKNTSTLVKNPAPGTVYKNSNIWVGTSGFAVPNNIKAGVIRFRVDNSWIANNNLTDSEIRMVRWDGNLWYTLDTGMKEKDSTNTYFEAITDTFSPFAITGLKGAEIPATTPSATMTPAETTPAIEIRPPMNWALIIGLLAVIGIAVIVYIRWKSR